MDNGFRPPGEIHMSSTTETPPQVNLSYNENIGSETVTHHLTLYRASAAGALVFDAGTVQWSWGLNSNHDGDQVATGTAMQQATVNLLADMGAAPGSLVSGLTYAPEPADTTAPTSSITSPSAGASYRKRQHGYYRRDRHRLWRWSRGGRRDIHGWRLYLASGDHDVRCGL